VPILTATFIVNPPLFIIPFQRVILPFSICQMSVKFQFMSVFFLSLSNIQSKGLIAVDDKSKPPHSCSHAIFIILIITNNP